MKEHEELVKRLAKDGKDILKSLTPEKCFLLHMSSKLCSEAGEVMDAVGKHIYYEQPLDYDNIIEELGDIEFYLQGIRQVLRIHRDACLIANIEKLELRYAEGYSDKSAKERRDKQ